LTSEFWILDSEFQIPRIGIRAIRVLSAFRQQKTRQPKASGLHPFAMKRA
jgi:hypothetical protein